VQYEFYGLWGRQIQESPRAAHTLATPLKTDAEYFSYRNTSLVFNSWNIKTQTSDKCVQI